MKEKIACAICVICSLFLLWIGFSFIDIVVDNTSGEAVHSEYNAFVAGVGD